MPVKVRTTTIDEAKCKQCGICVDVCPREVLAADDKGQIKVVNLEACTGCLLCELSCPELAISLEAIE
jgi:2-oxoglutarate ferredoxin oxidoreductase subunit delta